MKYDFDTVINRRSTDSYKWDVKENELPMWVADMDFPTAPEIVYAIKKRAEHGIYGYTVVPDEWYGAYINWWKRRHNFEINKEWLMFCTGVIPTISSTVRKLTTPAENVVIQTPVYNHFYSSILNNGRNVLENPLKYDGENYSMDFEDLKEKLSRPQTSLMLLCNPQNPSGKIWNRETLQRVGELCEKYHVIVLSDEIHCDLTAPNQSYTPFASISDICANNSITCISPTKTFNIAGLQTSAIFVPNENLRHKVNRAINTDEVAEPNVFAVTAAIAAFTEGEMWLDELRNYIEENRVIVGNYLKENIPNLTLVKSNATYLLWLDCSSFTKNSTEFAEFIRKKTGLYLSAGEIFGANGSSFLRMNIACPKSTLADGLNRLKNGVELFCK